MSKLSKKFFLGKGKYCRRSKNFVNTPFFHDLTDVRDEFFQIRFWKVSTSLPDFIQGPFEDFCIARKIFATIAPDVNPTEITQNYFFIFREKWWGVVYTRVCIPLWVWRFWWGGWHDTILAEFLFWGKNSAFWRITSSFWRFSPNRKWKDTSSLMEFLNSTRAGL